MPVNDFTGDLKILPERIKAVDQDEGLCAVVQYSIMPSSESAHFLIDSKTGAIKVVTPLDPLDMLHAVTLVIKATQVNNADRYALTTLVISKKDVCIKS